VTPRQPADDYFRARRESVGAHEVAALFSGVGEAFDVESTDPDEFDPEDEGEDETVSLQDDGWELWNKKTRRVAAHQLRPKSQRVSWGRELQPVIGPKIAETKGWKIRQPKGYYRDPQQPWLGCQADCELDIDGDGLWIPADVRCIGVNEMSRWRNAARELRVPGHVRLQMQAMMAVCDTQRSVVLALVGGNEDHAIFVDRDQDTIDDIRYIVGQFGWNVENDVEPPDVDFMRDRTQKILNILLTNVNPGEVLDWTQDHEMKALVERMRYNATQSNQFKKEADAARAELRKAMGEAEVANLGDLMIKRKLVPGNDQRRASVRLNISKTDSRHIGASLNKSQSRGKKRG